MLSSIRASQTLCYFLLASGYHEDDPLSRHIMQLSSLIQPGRPLRREGDNLFSALPKDTPPGAYDGRARLYDAIVGSSIYNRLLWGARTGGYRTFARRALGEGAGLVLDAGSGSAVFTAEAYAETGRPVALVDRSIGMLRAARARISKASGGNLSSQITLVQADLFDLPFRKEAFSTVLSMGVLHLFANAAELVQALLCPLAPGGLLYLTSLVTDRAVGRQYLAALEKAGEVATPRSFAETRAAIEAAPGSGDIEGWRAGNMAFFVVSKAS